MILNASIYATLSIGLVKLENYSWNKLAPKRLSVDLETRRVDQSSTHITITTNIYENIRALDNI